MLMVIKGDGAYSTDRANGWRIPGVAIVNVDGSVTIHVPSRDVIIEESIDPMQTYDMTDAEICRVAVREGQLTIEKVRETCSETANEIERPR